MTKNRTEQVQRQDFLDLIWREGAEALRKTDEGFLIGTACVTNIGIFSYLLPDGSVRNELRLPEEVFAEDSLATLKGKPLANDHPDVAVDPDNVGTLGVGSLGMSPFHDDTCVYSEMVFQRRSAIDAINGGKRALSCGYTCELEFTSGEKWGQHYDAIQRKIRYNHVALVDRGRAGEDAVLRMDSAGWRSSVPQFTHENRSEPMKKIRIDTGNGLSAEYEAEDGFIAAYTTLKGDHAAVSAEKTRIQATLDAKEVELKTAKADAATAAAAADAAKADVARLTTELKTTKDASPEAIAAGVKARLDLLGVAALAKVEIKDDMDDTAVRLAVIVASDAEFKADGYEPAYIAARFDIAAKGFRKAAPDAHRVDHADVPNKDGKETKVDAATKKYNQSLQDAWKA